MNVFQTRDEWFCLDEAFGSSSEPEPPVIELRIRCECGGSDKFCTTCGGSGTECVDVLACEIADSQLDSLCGNDRCAVLAWRDSYDRWEASL